MPFTTKTATEIPTQKPQGNKLKIPMDITSVLTGTTAVTAVSFGLLNLSTAGIPAITLGAVAGAVALRTKIINDKKHKKPEAVWYADTSKQRSYYGKVTANYLIGCLFEVDAVLSHLWYKKYWWAGITNTGVPVMIGSHGDFKVFDTREEMQEMAYYFLKMGCWGEIPESKIEELRPKRKYEDASAIDFIQHGVDLDAALSLGRLIRNDHADKDLESYEVLSQGWKLYALQNGMFIACRGTRHLTWRVFFNREQFYRFFDRAMQKEKRLWLQSEDISPMIEDIDNIESEDEIMHTFLNNIVFITA